MAIGTSIAFALLAMLCWGVGDFLIQRATRKIGDIETIAFIGIIGSIALLPFAANDFGLLLQPANVILLSILGILTFVIGLCDFEALRKGKLCIVDVILEMELPVTIALSFIFFREVLSVVQSVVISLIFVGILLIATKSICKKHLRLEKGVLLAALAAIGMGMMNFLTAAEAKAASPVLAIWVPWVIFTAFSLLIIAKRERMPKLLDNLKKFKLLILGMGAFDTLAWLFYALAVLRTEISITTAITESYPAIAIALGFLVNKERMKWYQYFGAGLALVSSFVLALIA